MLCTICISDIGAEKTQKAMLTESSMNVTRRPMRVLLDDPFAGTELTANVDECPVQLTLDDAEY